MASTSTVPSPETFRAESLTELLDPEEAGLLVVPDEELVLLPQAALSRPSRAIVGAARRLTPPETNEVRGKSD